jgi:glycosyltransferase involved in cell wall biosynthesis
MSIRTCDILMGNLHEGDATSAHAFELTRLLQSHGVAVRIHCNYPVGPLPEDIQPLSRTTHPGDYAPAADLTILEYPLWYPLAERFRDVHGAKVFWYHGVTPPALWATDTERDLLTRAEAGTELAWYAHLAVTTSPFTARELHRHSGYPQGRIRTVPLGVDIATFRQKPSSSLLRSHLHKWKLEHKRVLLYTGRVAGNKRIDLLIQALARLKDVYRDLHLLIVGDTKGAPAYREVAAKLRAQADQLGLTSHVTFTGWVPAITPYYHLADVYVTASQHEGFGVPLLEAMAAGVPVIASASGAMPWVLKAQTSNTEPAGLLFPEGDVDALARQVSRVLEEPALRGALIERGYERVGHFSQEQFNLRATKVLDEANALARRGPPPAAYRPQNRLYDQADVSLRNYRVRSKVPVLGPLIEWIRRNSTSHIKEAYLDRIIERQVLYNRLLAREIFQLRAEIARLHKERGRDAESGGIDEDSLDDGN